LREEEFAALLGGLSTFYPETVRPAPQVLHREEGRSIVSAVYLVVVNGRPLFFTDCAVNLQPDASQLAEIAVAAADTASEVFGREPRGGVISYADFGS